jgi:hypothetical protein
LTSAAASASPRCDLRAWPGGAPGLGLGMRGGRGQRSGWVRECQLDLGSRIGRSRVRLGGGGKGVLERAGQASKAAGRSSCCCAAAAPSTTCVHAPHPNPQPPPAPQNQVIGLNTPLSQQAGYYCSVCDCVLRDSQSYLDHINGGGGGGWFGWVSLGGRLAGACVTASPTWTTSMVHRWTGRRLDWGLDVVAGRRRAMSAGGWHVGLGSTSFPPHPSPSTLRQVPQPRAGHEHGGGEEHRGAGEGKEGGFRWG